MITIKPDFFDRFKCIASRCTDSCCIGWEIDIDEESYNRYLNYKGDFAPELKKNITHNGDYPLFKLKEHDRCPFLNENNLCNMIINCGEDMLCEICREHPRFYEWYEGYQDKGLGLCCEEAVRLLFENNDSLKFFYEDDGFQDETDEGTQALIKTRENCFDILRNRKLTFTERLENLMLYGEAVQKGFFEPIEYGEEDFSKEEIIEEIFYIWEKCEPFDDSYNDVLKNLRNNIRDVLSHEKDFEEYLGENNAVYEKLLCYIIFRYYMKCLYDGDLMGKLSFSLINLWFVKINDIYNFIQTGKFDMNDRIYLTKYWSKQFEYSEENVDLLMDECSENNKLVCREIIKLF